MKKSKVVIENVAAKRYASSQMTEIWSEENKILFERELWITVLELQSKYSREGKVSKSVIDVYRRVADRVDLDSIIKQEKKTRHDVKAKIDEFCQLAGFQAIHRGMTSRDLTDNVEQMQILRSLNIVMFKTVAVLTKISEKASFYKCLPIAARTHNIPAQITTFGKRLANAGEEILIAFQRLENLILQYPLRGLKGPVGTSQDQLDLLNGNVEFLSELEEEFVD